MKVILQSDVKNLGKRGDLVDVAEGYARNFLIPRGLAVEANASNLRSLENQKSQAKARQERELEEARRQATQLGELTVKIARKSGEGGRLFGSVTPGDIADAVRQAAGIALDKRKIELDEPIKALGTYEVSVRLHPGVSASLKVQVVEG